MKRFHVHVRVKELQDSISFYNALFNAEPTTIKEWLKNNFPIYDCQF